MATISEALSKTTTPYSRPPAVKVKCIYKKSVDRATSFNFNTDKVTVASAKHYMHFGVTDGQHAIKVVINLDYQSCHVNMEEGFFYIIKGYAVLKESKTGQDFFLITKDTKIFRTGIFDVSVEAQERAIRVIEPQSVTAEIGEKTPEGHLATLQGRVDAVSTLRPVKLLEGEVPIVDLAVADGCRRVQVSLWREAALNTIYVGQHITITHLRWTTDKTVGFKWNSTSYTTIKETETGARTEVVKIIGVVDEDQHIMLFTEKEEEFHIQCELFKNAFHQMSVEQFINTLPIECAAKIQHNEIIEVL